MEDNRKQGLVGIPLKVKCNNPTMYKWSTYFDTDFLFARRKYTDQLEEYWRCALPGFGKLGQCACGSVLPMFSWTGQF